MATYYIEKDKLKGEYKDTFEKVEAYSMLKGLDTDTDEEMMMNLVDMLYTAQVEEKPVEKIVGNDIEKFCKDYFQDFNKNTLEDIVKRTPNLFYTISWTIFILCLLEILLPEEKVGITKASVDISGIILGSIVGIIVSALIVYAGRSIIFRIKRVNATVLAFIYLIIFFGAVMISVVLSDDRNIKIPLLYSMILSGIYIILYKSFVLYKRYKETGTIRKKKKKGPMREIWDSAIEEGIAEIPIEWKKKWERKNKRRRKRGKPEITPQEFTEKVKKENKNSIYGDIILFVVYAGIYISSLVATIKEGSVTETIITAIVEFIILAALYKAFMFKKIRLKREEIINRCEEEGISIIDMADRIEQEKMSREEEYRKEVHNKEQ